METYVCCFTRRVKVTVRGNAKLNFRTCGKFTVNKAAEFLSRNNAYLTRRITWSVTFSPASWSCNLRYVIGYSLVVRATLRHHLLTAKYCNVSLPININQV